MFLTHFTTVGAIFLAPATIGFVIALHTGFTYLPLLESPQSANVGNASSPTHRACSCTCLFPPRSHAVPADKSHAFCVTYHNHFCTVSNPVAPQNTALAQGITPVATQNHACTVHFEACRLHSATSCIFCADATVPSHVPSCSVPHVTIHGADTAILPIPHNAFAHCHRKVCGCPSTISAYSGNFLSHFTPSSSSDKSLYSGNFTFTICPSFANQGFFAISCPHLEIS